MRVYALSNQKGGVGKTTVCLAIAQQLAVDGHRVLVVDADPQASATRMAGLSGAEGITLTDVLLGAPGEQAERLTTALRPASAVPGEWGFAMVPTSLHLASKERNRRLADEHDLKTALEAVAADYDYCLLDTPPSLGALTVMALTAAERLVIVTQPSYLALQGLGDLLETHQVISEHYNPALQLAGVVLNRVQHTREHQERIRELEAYFEEDRVWQPHLAQRTIIEAAAGMQVPLTSLGAYKGADRAAYQVARLVRHHIATPVDGYQPIAVDSAATYEPARAPTGTPSTSASPETQHIPQPQPSSAHG